MAKVRIEFAAVVGAGDFPVDMFRYDFCCPATEADSYCVVEPNRNTEAGAGLRVVVVKRIIAPDVVAGGWTPDRWRSFGWELVTGIGKGYQYEDEARRRGTGMAEGFREFGKEWKRGLA